MSLASKTLQTRALLLTSVVSLALAGCSAAPSDGTPAPGDPSALAPSPPGAGTGTAPAGSSTAPPSGAPSAGSDGGTSPDGGTPSVESKGIFVAVGYGGRRIRSIDDGKTWVDDVSSVTQGGDDDLLLRTVVHANGEFVGLGYRAVRSTDGKTWQPLSAPFGQWIGAATWQGGHFVAVGGYGLRATSTNGTSWVDTSIDNVASHAHDALAFGGGRFASANDDGARTTSADGIAWTRSTGAEGVATYAMAYGNGTFVALGNANVVRSTDGGKTFGSAKTLGATCQGLVFAQGHFTALADGHAFTSSDGVTWVDHASSSAHRGLVAYGHGTYVVLANQGRQRSLDGVTWEAPIADGNKNPLEAIVFGAL